MGQQWAEALRISSVVNRRNAGDFALATGGWDCVERDAPHSLQNFAPGGFSVPQAEHTRGSGEPHSLQNFAPS